MYCVTFASVSRSTAFDPLDVRPRLAAEHEGDDASGHVLVDAGKLVTSTWTPVSSLTSRRTPALGVSSTCRMLYAVRGQCRASMAFTISARASAPYTAMLRSCSNAFRYRAISDGCVTFTWADSSSTETRVSS